MSKNKSIPLVEAAKAAAEAIEAAFMKIVLAESKAAEVMAKADVRIEADVAAIEAAFAEARAVVPEFIRLMKLNQ